MANGIELIAKTSNSFDLSIIRKLRSSPYLASPIVVTVIDLDNYYELALEMLRANRSSNNIFILLCDKMLKKYRALYSFYRVAIEKRNSIFSVYCRVDGIIKAFGDFLGQRNEIKDIISLLLCNNEEALGNNLHHNLHVAVISYEILMELKKNGEASIASDDIRLISEAAIFHDLGKSYVPKEILLKPEALTKEEYEIVKKHTLIGSKIIEKSLDVKNNRLAKYCYEVTRWHHERYDGGGYPDGLRGNEIPLSAQVVGLADAYDALTSKRVYKAPVKSETAIEMIKNGECGGFKEKLVFTLSNILNKLPKNI